MEGKYRSRKFLIVSVTLVFSGVCLWLDKMDGGDFSAIALTCVGAYNLANAWAAKS